MTFPNIQTACFSPSLYTLNANAGLTLSCQAFLFAGRLQQKAYWQMAPLSAAGGGKGGFKW